jgi:ATP-dependent Clp endopeptidase proteolytic subunit ClpP
MNVIPFPKAQKWFDIRNANEETADVYLYDVIGDSWTGNDAATVVKDIVAIKAARINLHINSPGGSVFDGVAIYNTLKNHSAKVTTHIDGLAASIASIIALAGDEIIIAQNAMMMIHNPWTMAWGESKDLRKQADVLDQVKETLLNTYVAKTGKDRDTVSADMDAELWLTADEAKEYGLADTIGGAMKAAAQVRPEVAQAFGFRNPPAALVAAQAAKPTFSATPRSILERKQALREKIAQ